MYYCRALGNILSLAFILVPAMASTDMNAFFPDVKGNLTKITWAHAVNEFNYLLETLSNEKIMMIEADVVLGNLEGTGNIIPIMAHPPATTSNLSVEAFFFEVKKFNKDEANLKKKGVKLDFKSIEAFQASVEIIQRYDKGEYPIWLNADIISGPINATTTPVDADKFLSGSSVFSNATLSIGWTTLYGSNYSGSYNQDQIQNMTTALTKNSVTQDKTFPVRAGLAAESVDILVGLLGDVENSTLTIWSSEGDNVNVDHLRDLIRKVTISRVYVDVPADLLDKLHLDNLGNRSTKRSVSMAGVVVSVLLGLISFCKI